MVSRYERNSLYQRCPLYISPSIADGGSGSTLRLCSSAKGIVSRCRTFSPSIVFCTPNELNAIRTSLQNALPNGGAILPLAKSMKRSLLRSGNVSKETFWDKFIFGKITYNVVGPNLRCIIVSAEEGSKSGIPQWQNLLQMK